MKRVILILAVLLLPCGDMSAAPQGTEKITNFESLIAVEGDGTIMITETITVIAAGKEIKRGIYRSFPTRYRDRFGNRVKVRFDVVEVLKNGNSEPWHLRNVQNGVRVYIGRSDVFIDAGRYTYTLRYRTERQIGFFGDFDEIYWNVTGNDWSFTIEEASAEVRLPPGATLVESIAYTGAKGKKGTDYLMERRGNGSVFFSITSPLAPGEGLTIAASWPKGFVPEPQLREKAAWFGRDNPGSVSAAVGFILLLLYYFIVWSFVGKDPPKSVIVPYYSPPELYSPAAVRYVMRMGYSNRVFASSIVSMAVKGYLTIRDEGSGYTLERGQAPESALSKGEMKIASKLLGVRRSVKLTSSNHSHFSEAIKELKKVLRQDFDTIAFITNARWLIPGIAVTLITLAAVVIHAPEKGAAAFSAFWLTMWTFGCFGLAKKVFQSWADVLSGGGGLNFIAALFITLFSLPFFGGELLGLGLFAQSASPVAAAALFILAGTNLLFQHLLKAPTVEGRRAMDRIEGFKMYLEATEQDRLDRLTPPEKTPELFERYLPYAIALDVENAWGEKFAAILSRSGEGKGTAYHPGWYSGRSYHAFDPGAISSRLGSSLASALSSSARAPGSSSGSGGGGSSGGGGGGGGGGGW